MDIFPRNDIKDSVMVYILDRPETEIKVTVIANELKVSKGHVSEAVKHLKNYGLIRKNKVDIGSPYVRSLKIAINISKIIKSGIIRKIEKLGVETAGIYGSWARGMNTENSDIDIWIKTPKDFKAIDVARISSEVRYALNIQPQILVLNRDKIDKIKNDNSVFYFSLIFGSIILLGDGIGRT